MVSGEQSQIPDIFVIGSQRVKITSTGLSNARFAQGKRKMGDRLWAI